MTGSSSNCCPPDNFFTVRNRLRRQKRRLREKLEDLHTEVIERSRFNTLPRHQRRLAESLNGKIKQHQALQADLKSADDTAKRIEQVVDHLQCDVTEIMNTITGYHFVETEGADETNDCTDGLTMSYASHATWKNELRGKLDRMLSYLYAQRRGNFSLLWHTADLSAETKAANAVQCLGREGCSGSAPDPCCDTVYRKAFYWQTNHGKCWQRPHDAGSKHSASGSICGDIVAQSDACFLDQVSTYCGTIPITQGRGHLKRDAKRSSAQHYNQCVSNPNLGIPMYVRLITTSFPCITTPGAPYDVNNGTWSHDVPDPDHKGITGWQAQAAADLVEGNPRCSVDVMSWYYLTSSFVYNLFDTSQLDCGDEGAKCDAVVSITQKLVDAFNMSQCLVPTNVSGALVYEEPETANSGVGDYVEAIIRRLCEAVSTGGWTLSDVTAPQPPSGTDFPVQISTMIVAQAIHKGEVDPRLTDACDPGTSLFTRLILPASGTDDFPEVHAFWGAAVHFPTLDHAEDGDDFSWIIATTQCLLNDVRAAQSRNEQEQARIEYVMESSEKDEAMYQDRRSELVSVDVEINNAKISVGNQLCSELDQMSQKMACNAAALFDGDDLCH